MSNHETYWEDDDARRTHHCEMERKRRDQMKESFTCLNEILAKETIQQRVKMDGTRTQIGRAKILIRARDYILSMEERNKTYRREIEALGREVSQLQAAVESTEKIAE